MKKSRKISERITQSECRKIYIQLKNNADRRWRSAELLKSDGDNGGAVQSGIISLEESIKAFIMLLDSKGFEFHKVQNIKFILNRSHVVRHFMLFFLFLLKVLSTDLIEILRQVNSPHFMKDYSENPGKYYKLGFEFVVNKLIVIQRELPWFLQLEKKRQHGVHLEVDLSGNSIITAEINFEEVFNRLDDLRKAMNEFLTAFDEPELIAEKELNNLRNTFIKENWYGKIDQSLENQFKNRKNPFDDLQKMLSNANAYLDTQTQNEILASILSRENPESNTSNLNSR